MRRIRYDGDDERLQGLVAMINTIVVKIDHEDVLIGTQADPRTMTFDGLRANDIYVSYAPSFLLSPDPVAHLGIDKSAFYADNEYRFDLHVNRQSTTSRNYYSIKMEGLTVGESYTISYTVSLTPESLSMSHSNMVGLMYADTPYIASLPVLSNEVFGQWYSDINYQSFVRDSSSPTSYENTFTATSQTMYMVVIHNDVKSNYVSDWTPVVINNLYCHELTTGYKINSMWIYLQTSGNASYPYAWTEISTGEGGSGAVDDVLVNGSSVVSNGIASINLSGYAQRSELGTAAEKDVPASGDASSAQVVMGSDSRLSDSRPASDVSAWAKASTKPSYTASEVGAIPATDKGTLNGVATLDANGLIPSSQLPSYVDDVLEYASVSAFPLTGEAGKIYVALDTNRTYRWGGSEYAEISASIALGETQGTAYEGNKGKANADAITALQSNKVDKETGKGLSTNDFTTAEKNKLSGIAAGAEANVQSDWSQTTTTADDYIKNKPTSLPASDVYAWAKASTKPTYTASEVGLGNVPNVTTDNQTPTVTEATTRANIASGDTLKTIIGKIKKFFADLKTVAFSGSYNDLTDKPTNEVDTPDAVPFLYRQIPHTADRVYVDEIVGASLGWNQLVANSGSSLSATITSGHKYVMKKSGTWSVGASTGTAITGLTGGSDVLVDITLAFGSTIADYVNTLGSTNGLAFLRSYGFFTKDYYPYDAGSIQSVKTSGKRYVGKNLWDEKYENISGTLIYLPVFVGDNTVTMSTTTPLDSVSAAELFILSGIVTTGANTTTNGVHSSRTRTVVASDGYVTVAYRTQYGANPKDYQTQLEIGTQSTDYEPYTERTYDIQDTDLRGIIKLVDNKLVYDGDIYKADGSVTREYGIVPLASKVWIARGNNIYSLHPNNLLENAPNSKFKIVCSKYTANIVSSASIGNKEISSFGSYNYSDLFIKDTEYSDATSFVASLDGVYLVYELANPTTETATPYANHQICDKNGTEEFIDDRTVPVPVGHNSRYVNLPSSMDSDYISYLVDKAENAASKDELGDLAYIDKDGESSEKFLRGDGTWAISNDFRYLLNNPFFTSSDWTNLSLNGSTVGFDNTITDGFDYGTYLVISSGFYSYATTDATYPRYTARGKDAFILVKRYSYYERSQGSGREYTRSVTPHYLSTNLSDINILYGYLTFGTSTDSDLTITFKTNNPSGNSYSCSRTVSIMRIF